MLTEQEKEILLKMKHQFHLTNTIKEMQDKSNWFSFISGIKKETEVKDFLLSEEFVQDNITHIKRKITEFDDDIKSLKESKKFSKELSSNLLALLEGRKSGLHEAIKIIEFYNKREVD